MSTALTGCDDVQGTVSCTNDTTCQSQAKSLYGQDGAITKTQAFCCQGFCVLPAQGTVGDGCDSQVRYLTSAPSFGACVPNNACTQPPQPDMSVMDMSSGDGSM